MNPMQRITTLLLSLLFLSGLNGCSFQLRDSYQLPTNLQAVRLDSIDSLELEASLTQRLLTAGIQVVDASTSSSTTIIRVLSDQLERRTLSLFESGQVAEYELIYQINYQVIREGNIEYDGQVEVARDYQDDPNFALAKTRERELLVSEMRDEATRRLVRQLISEFSD
jgi:LPS-assembly lipoprotein